jgi:hypothetical protein
MGRNLRTVVKGEAFMDVLDDPIEPVGCAVHPLRSFVGGRVGTLQTLLTDVVCCGVYSTEPLANSLATPFQDFSLMLGILWGHRSVGFVGRYDYRRDFFFEKGFLPDPLGLHDLRIPGTDVSLNVSGHAMALGVMFESGFSRGVRRYLYYIYRNMGIEKTIALTFAYGYSGHSAMDLSVQDDFIEIGNAAPGELWHSPAEYYLGFLYSITSTRELLGRHGVSELLTLIFKSLKMADLYMLSNRMTADRSVGMLDVVARVMQ